MGIRGAGGNHIIHMGQEPHDLFAPGSLDLEIDRDKRRVINRDSDLLDGRDEKVRISILPQNRRKQFDKPFAADRGAEIEPGPVPRNPHVQITAIRWIPEMYRRQPPCCGLFCGGGQAIGTDVCLTA